MPKSRRLEKARDEIVGANGQRFDLREDFVTLSMVVGQVERESPDSQACGDYHHQDDAKFRAGAVE